MPTDRPDPASLFLPRPRPLLLCPLLRPAGGVPSAQPLLFLVVGTEGRQDCWCRWSAKPSAGRARGSHGRHGSRAPVLTREKWVPGRKSCLPSVKALCRVSFQAEGPQPQCGSRKHWVLWAHFLHPGNRLIRCLTPHPRSLRDAGLLALRGGPETCSCKTGRGRQDSGVPHLSPPASHIRMSCTIPGTGTEMDFTLRLDDSIRHT